MSIVFESHPTQFLSDESYPPIDDQSGDVGSRFDDDPHVSGDDVANVSAVIGGDVSGVGDLATAVAVSYHDAEPSILAKSSGDVPSLRLGLDDGDDDPQRRAAESNGRDDQSDGDNSNSDNIANDNINTHNHSNDDDGSSLMRTENHTNANNENENENENENTSHSHMPSPSDVSAAAVAAAAQAAVAEAADGKAAMEAVEAAATTATVVATPSSRLLASVSERSTVTPKEMTPTILGGDGGAGTMTVPSRIKSIPKPERTVEKNDEGMYQCTYPDCVEDVQQFARKCEYNKHMDKHERPYRCTAEGCEKLPGFTYSGGLLRHEREVHNKHGGPRHPLCCPHATCKRHAGKGFSRLENLNEHLRRVHTPTTGPGGVGLIGGGDAFTSAQVAAVAAAANYGVPGGSGSGGNGVLNGGAGGASTLSYLRSYLQPTMLTGDESDDAKMLESLGQTLITRSRKRTASLMSGGDGGNGDDDIVGADAGGDGVDDFVNGLVDGEKGMVGLEDGGFQAQAQAQAQQYRRRRRARHSRQTSKNSNASSVQRSGGGHHPGGGDGVLALVDNDNDDLDIMDSGAIFIEQFKRVRRENRELRIKLELQSQHLSDMMQKMAELLQKQQQQQDHQQQMQQQHEQHQLRVRMEMELQQVDNLKNKSAELLQEHQQHQA